MSIKIALLDTLYPITSVTSVAMLRMLNFASSACYKKSDRATAVRSSSLWLGRISTPLLVHCRVIKSFLIQTTCIENRLINTAEDEVRGRLAIA